MGQPELKQLAVLLLLPVIIMGCGCINRAPAEFEVTALEVVGPAVAGETYNVKAEVFNKGGKKGTYTAVLRIDGQEVDAMDIEVPAGGVGEILFPVIPEEPVFSTLEVGGTSTTVRVLKPAELQVSNLKVSPSFVFPGKEIVITAVAKNIGGAKGSLTPALYVDDVEVDSLDLTIEPWATESISFSIARDLPGDYEISISGSSGSTKTVTVGDVVPYYNEQFGFSMMRPGGWQVEESHNMVVIQDPGKAMFVIMVERVLEEKSLEDLCKDKLEIWAPGSAGTVLDSIVNIGKAEDGSEVLGHKVISFYQGTSGEKIIRYLMFTKIGPRFYTMVVDSVLSDENINNNFLYNACFDSIELPGLVDE